MLSTLGIEWAKQDPVFTDNSDIRSVILSIDFRIKHKIVKSQDVCFLIDPPRVARLLCFNRSLCFSIDMLTLPDRSKLLRASTIVPSTTQTHIATIQWNNTGDAEMVAWKQVGRKGDCKRLIADPKNQNNISVSCFQLLTKYYLKKVNYRISVL